MTTNNAYSLIEPLMKDPQIMEILIDGYKHLYVERRGELLDVPSPFESEAQLYALINELAQQYGASVDE